MLNFEPFDTKNIPLIVDQVFPMWSDFDGPLAYRRHYTEYIVRNNLFENDLCFQLTDSESGDFLANAFFMHVPDSCLAKEWLAAVKNQYTDEEVAAFEKCAKYIEDMDARVQAYMKNDDIQMTLYVSRKKGAGSAILEKALEILRERGYKNLYLWTDCECSWEWYTNHGYELVERGVCDQFSHGDQEYSTFIFRRKI